MSRLYDLPEPSEINYHEAQQVQRVENARKQIDPGDVLAVIDSRIAAESDPAKHPIYQLVCWGSCPILVIQGR